MTHCFLPYTKERKWARSFRGISTGFLVLDDTACLRGSAGPFDGITAFGLFVTVVVKAVLVSVVPGIVVLFGWFVVAASDI